MNLRPLISTAAAVAALTIFAPSALAGPPPDAWTPWVVSSGPQDTTIRSLDFTAAATPIASSESDGVFQAPTTLGPWQQTNGGLDTPDDKSVYQVVAKFGTLYAATSTGLFTSPQSANPSWTQVGAGPGNNTLDMGGVQSVVPETASNLVVAIAGAADPGVYTSADSGGTWHRASGMPDGENIFQLAQGPGPLIYAAGDSGVWTSTDGGTSWTLTSDGIDPAETTFRVAVDPTTPSTLWAAADEDVYKSVDGGLTWNKFDGVGLTALPGAQLKQAFLLASPLGEGISIVGTQDGVWATIDGGLDWGQMSVDSTESGGFGLFGQRIVTALNVGISPPRLLAGTRGFGVYSLPLSPVSAPNSLTLTETSGVQPGDTIGVSGAWAGTAPLFYTYKWKRCTSPSNCTDVGNGGDGAMFTVPDSDASSSTTYEVQVCATNLISLTPVCETSGQTTGGVAGIPGSAPVPYQGINDTSLSPDPNQSYPWGTTFTIKTGDWGTESDPSTMITPLDYGFMWERCDQSNICTVIPGATSVSYTTTTADVGNSIVGYVEANYGLFPSYSSQFYLAGATFTIIEKTPVNTVAPKIDGPAYVGTTLQSTAGAWDGHDPTYTREWLECGADGLDCNRLNPDQTGDTYTITSADLGSRLELQVTATQFDPSQDRVGVADSALTPVITNAPTGGGGGGGGGGGQPPVITITGPHKLVVGARLTGPATVAGYTKIAYQWLRNGKAIEDATGATYKLTKSDLGQRLSLRVTLTGSGGSQVVATSNTIKVPKPKANHHKRRRRRRRRR